MDHQKVEQYDVIVVGGGIAGVVAATYLSRSGYQVLLLEKQNKCGGLVNTFVHNGFTFDGGVRATENSGVLLPMLKDLGVDLDLVRNKISLGVEDQIIKILTESDVETYQNFLTSLYPEAKEDIAKIIIEIRKIMHYMEIQYGIDNPVFMDLQDKDYLINTIMPWATRFFITVPKINKIKGSANEYLKKFTDNQSLLDIISQHFFQETPAFFALSYLKIYLDYYYPRGGTAKLIDALLDIFQAHHGEVRTKTTVVQLNPAGKQLVDQKGTTYQYQKLIWAADQKTLYDIIDEGQLGKEKVIKAVREQRKRLSGLAGNDSVLTLFLETELPPDYFSDIATEHVFYTANKVGQSKAGELPLFKSQAQIKDWLDKYLSLTTYEISIPALRDTEMAPEGKTGLIVSVLFDYQLIQQIEHQNWYEELKDFCTRKMIQVLDTAIYPGLEASVTHSFVSTPLTFERMFGNYQGAITGWSFTNAWMPSESRMLKIANSVKTLVPDIYQAGQWTYSPSGFPISILTGKMAADAVGKKLKK